MAPQPDITELLRAARSDASAAEALYNRIYDELKGVARNQLRSERTNHTLEPTALVNEAYLKLVDQSFDDWKNRHQFFAVASRAIRRILVDYARTRKAAKRGSGEVPAPLELAKNVSRPQKSPDLVALDDALTRLQVVDPQMSEIVEMRFFGGLKNEEIATSLGLSARTVQRHWQHAKAWLYRELNNDDA